MGTGYFFHVPHSLKKVACPHFIMKKSILIIAALALAAFFLFFFRLGSFALTDPDEVFYGQTSKEMLQRGEWLTPYLYGKPQFEKPILFYWLVEASYKIFGVNEFAARFPSAVLGLLGTIVTYLLGAALFSRRAGIFSSLIAAANVEYIALSRACVTDMALAVFLGAGFLFFIYGYRKGRALPYAASSAFFGLAVLTKGPIGILLPGAAILFFLFIRKDMKSIGKMPLVLMAFSFLAVTLPWYLAMYKGHGRVFIDEFFGFRHITRFLEPEHEWGVAPYYNIPVLFAGFFPWSAFLPVALWQNVRKAFADKDDDARLGHSFLLLWFAAFFVFFSISSTKLPTYIFPVFIPASVMVGALWNELAGPGFTAVLKWTRFAHFFLLVAVGAIAVGAYIFITRNYADIVNIKSAVSGGLIFITGIALSFVFFIRNRFTGSLVLIAASCVAFLVNFSFSVLPAIEIHETSRLAAEKLKTLMKTDEAVGCESHYQRGIAFYTGRFPADLDKHHELVKFLSRDKRVWAVLKEKNHIQLYELDTKPRYSKTTYVVWRLGKKCIVTNKIPDGGVYLEKRERAKP